MLTPTPFDSNPDMSATRPRHPNQDFLLPSALERRRAGPLPGSHFRPRRGSVNTLLPFVKVPTFVSRFTHSCPYPTLFYPSWEPQKQPPASRRGGRTDSLERLHLADKSSPAEESGPSRSIA